MTLTMADSIYPETLPAGYDAYLGYVDGHWPTIHGYTDAAGVYHPPLAQLFPGKLIISLTVTGATLDADGCDIETGDLSAVSGADWLKRKLATGPRIPPVAYCSVSSMGAVVAELAAIGVPRSSVLLLSAHYWPAASGGYLPHICGPASCSLIELPQDGTQWTDTAPGVGAQIDASLLTDNFFGGNPVALTAWQRGTVQVIQSATSPTGLAITGVGNDDVIYMADLHADFSTGPVKALTAPLTFAPITVHTT